jgi:hypothetical protein
VQYQNDMPSASISELVERAVEWTGMKSVLIQDRTRLVCDNGSSYLSYAFEDYLRMLEIRHIPVQAGCTIEPSNNRHAGSNRHKLVK